MEYLKKFGFRTRFRRFRPGMFGYVIGVKGNKDFLCKMRCAVIGAGAMGRNHIRVLSGMEGVELAAVSEIDPLSRKKIGRQYPCAVYGSHTEMLSRERLDMVCVVVPTGEHAKVALDCINRGINVLVEKPIADTLAEAAMIIEAAKKRRVRLLIGHVERFNPAVQELKRRIEAGELGRVFKLDIIRAGPFPPRIRDVGVVIDLAVHDIDIARYITQAEVESVYALTEKKIHTSHEDLMSALIRFRGGPICALNTNWLTPTKKRVLSVIGEKGMFVVNFLMQTLRYYENSFIRPDLEYLDILRGVSEGRMISYPIKKEEPLASELAHFADCVKNRREPIVTGEDGKTALEIARKILESAEKGRVV